MNKKLRMIYTQIVSPNTQWLPRYYAALKLIEREGDLVLDASCGTGDITIELRKRGTKVTGINIMDPIIRTLC